MTPKLQWSGCCLSYPQVSRKFNQEFKFCRPLNKLSWLSIFPPLYLLKTKGLCSPQRSKWGEITAFCSFFLHRWLVESSCSFLRKNLIGRHTIAQKSVESKENKNKKMSACCSAGKHPKTPNMDYMGECSFSSLRNPENHGNDLNQPFPYISLTQQFCSA